MDINKAKGIIEAILEGFPFVGHADKAHAYALFLLPYARDLIDGPTPLHMIEAPCAGSGKSLLAEALMMPASGGEYGAIGETASDDEWRKQLTSIFKESKSVVWIDNINSKLDSSALARALTLTSWADRLLGSNETLMSPIRCVWLATANNPTMSMEITRRTINIKLDPKVDRPWLRDGFKIQDLLGYVHERRGEIVWAALTLIQNWIAKGKPLANEKTLGSYEKWGSVIGGILKSAGIDGLLCNLADFYDAADTEGAALRSFVTAWWDKFQSDRKSARELLPIALDTDGFELAGVSERAQSVSLGKALRARKGMVVDGKCIELSTIKGAGGMALWKLHVTEKKPTAEQKTKDVHVEVVEIVEVFSPIQNQIPFDNPDKKFSSEKKTSTTSTTSTIELNVQEEPRDTTYTAKPIEISSDIDDGTAEVLGVERERPTHRPSASSKLCLACRQLFEPGTDGANHTWCAKCAPKISAS
jgi:hypothetical protein